MSPVGSSANASHSEELREPFTAAQAREINRIFTDTFAGFIDQIISKVQNMITSELQTSFDPVCVDLKNQIEILRNEIVYKLAPVQIGMKKYCFKHSGNFHNLHDHIEPNLVHASSVDNNLMQFDKLHVEDGPNLVRYFEKLVRDEVSSSCSAHVCQANLPRATLHAGDDDVEDDVSSCSSLHDLHSHNLMHPPQNNIGETLQDCIDFDELMNDFHSTAASAQLLQRSLSGSSALPVPPF